MNNILLGEPISGAGYNSVFPDANGLDPQLLRSCVLLHDKIGYAYNPSRPIEPGQDAGFLEEAGVLQTFEYSWYDNIPSYITVVQGQLDLYRKIDSNEPGLWSFSKNSNLPWPESHFTECRGFAIKLLNCIPIPSVDIPLNELLEFKEKRSTELLSLRSHIVELYEFVVASPDKPLAEQIAVAKLEQAIEEQISVSEESKLVFNWGSIDASFNLIASVGAGVAAFESGATPMQIAAASALGAAVSLGPVASLKENLSNYNLLIRT